MPFYFDSGRESMRCPNHDYSRPGHFFITICTQERECLFGGVKNDKMILNEVGKIVDNEIKKTPSIRKNFHIYDYVVMPNHVHIIVNILFVSRASDITPVGANGRSPLPNDNNHPSPSDEGRRFIIPRMKPRSLSSFVSGFKAATAVKINALLNSPGAPIWQRNFYDEIIRDKQHLFVVRNYIKSNPAHWAEDTDNLSVK